MNRFRILSALTMTTLLGAALLGCDETPLDESACRDGKIREGQSCIFPYGVKVNSVGYLTNRKKFAVWTGSGAKFEVRSVAGDASIKEGTAKKMSSPDTNEEVFVAEFSDVTQEGEYYVSVEGGVRSPAFVIGDSVFDEALEVTMLGLYGQRCGEAVELEFEGKTFKHDECHMKKASLSRVGGGERDDTGGWHDAGDYGKYVVNGAFAVGMLLQAFEHSSDAMRNAALPIPERGGKLPDVLDESKVELAWILKTQFEDGSFSHKVTAASFEGVLMPEFDLQERVFVSAGTAATGDAVAALALGARLLAEYDPEFAATCLEAAKRGQAFLDEHQESITPDQTGITTGGYTGGGDGDERVWALAELWETTGDDAYLADLESRLGETSVGGQFDWANVQNLGLGTYLRSKREGRDPAELAGVANGFLGSAKAISDKALGDAYGRGMAEYYWGTNGVVARLSYNLMAAHFVEPNDDYLDATHRQLDYLLGHNPYGRSFVTGLGDNPAQRPHHRPSQADGIIPPWPGLLVGGPHGEVFGGGAAKPPALTWQDDESDYMHNEIAINWNTALAYALMTLASTKSGGEGCPKCLEGGPDGAGGMGGGGASSK